MVHHFLRTNPYKMSTFKKSVTCSFFRNRTHILTRTQGKKFEDMFLVKIANKGTSLKRQNLQKKTLKINIFPSGSVVVGYQGKQNCSWNH